MPSIEILSPTTQPEPLVRGRAEVNESNVKSIVFLVHEDEGFEQRLQAALALARNCSAHLQLLHVVPVEAYTIPDTAAGAFVSPQIVEALENDAANLKARIEQKLGEEDVSWDYRSVTSVAIAELVGCAAFSDLVVLGREPREREFGRTAMVLAGQFLHRSSTPMFIPGDNGISPDLAGKAIIAWNGSLEAANAVRSAIGLLKMASDVRVIRYAEAEECAFPSTRLLEYLSRHGIHAELDERRPQGDIAADLVTYALGAHASYLVMGGYSHSRAGEFLFGGVTRDLLRACPLSLVMAH